MTLYALILAGGTGSRLWPHSRTQRPKQFLALTGDQTLLQDAQSRLEPLVDSDRVYVATNLQYIDLVQEQLPGVPRENVLGEPVGRGTAAAIGWAALHIRRRDPQATMAVVTADHIIRNTSLFREALASAAQVAQAGWLVTLGIQPSYPETGYGYIERGEPLGRLGGFESFRVRRFVEKPDLRRAEEYLAVGNYTWNSGMFVWRINRILEEIERHMDALFAGLSSIDRTLGDPNTSEMVNEIFSTLPIQTIDYGVMEKAEKVAVVPVDIGWNDVGSWSAVYDVLPKDSQDNAVVGRHISPDTHHSLVYSPNKLVATIGLEDLIVVDTEDVLLITPRARAQDVRVLVELLKADGDSHYLHSAVQPFVIAREDLGRLFAAANSLERVLISLILHTGLWPSQIAALESQQVDLSEGWVTTSSGKRPLPQISCRFLSDWLHAQNMTEFSLRAVWPASPDIRSALDDLSKRAAVAVTVDSLYETLARKVFDLSEVGRIVRAAFGEETNLVRVPLGSLFPFSLSDFSGNEDNSLGQRAHSILDQAAAQLSG